MVIINYNPASKLTSLSTETKIIWAVGFSIWMLLINSGTGQLILSLVLSGFAFYGGSKLSDILRYIRIFLPVFVIVFILHLFYHSGDMLFGLWFLQATDTGLKAGLFNVLRFVNFIMVAACFFNWTSPVEFAGKLSSGFGFKRIRFFQDMALVFFIAMRFIPVLTQEREIVRMAMIARGADFKSGLINRLKMETRLLLPLFSRVIRQSDDVAAAISIKGYKGVYFAGNQISLRGIDYILIILMVSITIVLIIL